MALLEAVGVELADAADNVDEKCPEERPQSPHPRVPLRAAGRGRAVHDDVEERAGEQCSEGAKEAGIDDRCQLGSGTETDQRRQRRGDESGKGSPAPVSRAQEPPDGEPLGKPVKGDGEGQGESAPLRVLPAVTEEGETCTVDDSVDTEAEDSEVECEIVSLAGSVQTQPFHDGGKQQPDEGQGDDDGSGGFEAEGKNLDQNQGDHGYQDKAIGEVEGPSSPTADHDQERSEKEREDAESQSEDCHRILPEISLRRV